MVNCTNDGCTKTASKQCKACHRTPYCSAACSKSAWPTHKISCFSEKNINAILARHEAEEAQKKRAEKKVKRPPQDRCTGCGTRFAEQDGSDEMEEDEDGVFPDAECETCGYLACESCASDHSSGSCYCDKSNFGTPYCELAPAYYHAGRNGTYKGDYHPDFEEYAQELGVGAYETRARACGNCGEVRRCLKK
ncbi:hypothetical protein PLICRDRAFT_429944 [Plicaturopsis crispa FD-325 SS-3]|uniref:MYND-type domain-containing protein n=1 Tax=Plicaturopsis crispa FD-325 SS-3 TaxID=944288 RepID=A0A0C9T6X1_PLICR|nr:hypothetical protein PLICRDRAFT_429944 [Plicaturopsis crispa FD-325 SS-3]